MEPIGEMNDDEFFAQARGANQSSMQKSRMDDEAAIMAVAGVRMSIKEARISMKMRKHLIIEYNMNKEMKGAVSRNTEPSEGDTG